MRPLEALLWPEEDLESAVCELLRRRGWPAPAARTRRTTADATAAARVERLLEGSAVEVDAVWIGDTADDEPGPGPAIWPLATAAGGRFLVVLERGETRTRLLARDGRTRWVATAEIEADWSDCTSDPASPELTRALEALDLDPLRRGAMLRRLAGRRRERLELRLRLAPEAPVPRQLRELGVLRRLAAFVALELVAVGLLALSWFAIGRWALIGGGGSRGAFTGWALAIASLAPLGALALLVQGGLAIDVAQALRLRLFRGALRLDPDEVRPRGSGSFLAQVLESERVEALSAAGGFSAMIGAVLGGAAFVALGFSPAAGTLRTLLAAGLVAVAGAAMLAHRRRRTWTDHRLEVSTATAEKLLGHRTRLVQERIEDRAEAEDLACAATHLAAEAFDRAQVRLQAIALGWRVVAFVVLVPVAAHVGGGVALAASIGGVLLGDRAMAALAGGLSSLSGARIAWTRVAPLFAAAARQEERPAMPSPTTQDAAELVARDVRFRFASRSQHALDGVDLVIGPGSRVVLEGRSGAGKSTLLSILAGRRPPSAGTVLLGRLDRAAIGDRAWRRRVALVPQFHENHVFVGPLGFNLLLGRGWPPTSEDFAEAEAVARDLGLGDLLDRMPMGLQQPVGDGAWELSHGERGRLFAARALLQRADVVLLDESFGGLDADTAAIAIECAERRARSLVLVSHDALGEYRSAGVGDHEMEETEFARRPA